MNKTCIDATVIESIVTVAKIYESFLTDLNDDPDAESIELNERIVTTARKVREVYDEAGIEITVPILWTMMFTTSIDREISDQAIAQNPLVKFAADISDLDIPHVMTFTVAKLAYDMFVSGEVGV